MSLTTPFSRNARIALGVVALHLAGLWALQNGLLRKAVEVIVPAEILSDVQIPSPLSASPRPALPVKSNPPALAPKPPVPAAPSPLATTSPSAPTNVGIAASPTASVPTMPINSGVQEDHSTTGVQYLYTPKTKLNRFSGRFGEQGTVILHVFVDVDGLPKKADILQSSGYERLDQLALKTVLDEWRFVPSKRAGVPEASWVNLPIKFELK